MKVCFCRIDYVSYDAFTEQIGGDGMSICPKNKSSKARRDKRRANWKMKSVNLVKCSKCGALMMPHRVCKSCGSYNKKEILANAE